MLRILKIVKSVLLHFERDQVAHFRNFLLRRMHLGHFRLRRRGSFLNDRLVRLIVLTDSFSEPFIKLFPLVFKEVQRIVLHFRVYPLLVDVLFGHETHNFIVVGVRTRLLITLR